MDLPRGCTSWVVPSGNDSEERMRKKHAGMGIASEFDGRTRGDGRTGTGEGEHGRTGDGRTGERANNSTLGDTCIVPFADDQNNNLNRPF
jgi:hypothetical protein